MIYNPRYPLARASTVKDELLVIQVMRQSVAECDPSYMLNLLKDLHSTRQRVIDHEGCITLCFEGWDDDPRETAEIPEIRTYFAALTEKFPYWLHYVEKSGDTFFHILRLLCTGHYEQRTQGMVVWSYDDLKEMQRTCLHLVDQMCQLDREKQQGREGNLAKQLVHMDAIILDELGYLPFPASGGALLTRWNSKLYEKTSLIITTNLNFAE